MHKKRNKFSLSDSTDIADLSQNLKDIAIKYPKVIEFLDVFCGYNTALLSSNPNEICYSQGKRDVVLTIHTLLRDDINPNDIAAYYSKL